MENPQFQRNMNLDPANATDVVCDMCSGLEFSQVYRIQRFSPLVNPTGEELFIPIQIFQCTSCGHINESFLKHASLA